MSRHEPWVRLQHMLDFSKEALDLSRGKSREALQRLQDSTASAEGASVASLGRKPQDTRATQGA
jgi:hypothetical protein